MLASSRRVSPLPPSRVSHPMRPYGLSLALRRAFEGLVLTGVVACSAGGSDSPSSSSTAGSGGSASTGGTGSSAPADALPARVRRLSNAEYDASVRVLLGATSAPSVELGFPPDAKQGPANSPAGPAFTVNDA